MLPESYKRSDAVYNLSRSALMTASLFSGKTENLRVAVQDKIHQPYRLGLIQDGDAVFRLSYELGSLGTYISGAGPTIIALIESESVAAFEKYALKNLENKGITGWRLSILDTDNQGATVSIA